MRTTIELPSQLRQKLISEATEKNLKGYSTIIVHALEEYFDKQTQSDSSATIRKLRGSLSETEYEEAIELIRTGRARWKM